MLFMKRNERITSSWGFLTQGVKTMMGLFVLMLSVQTVFAKQFEYGGVVYEMTVLPPSKTSPASPQPRTAVSIASQASMRAPR